MKKGFEKNVETKYGFSEKLFVRKSKQKRKLLKRRKKAKKR